MKTRTLYDVLQIAPNAARPIVDAAYEHLRSHCDLSADPAAGRLVDEAYATLRNPESRRAYDAKLAQWAQDAEHHQVSAPPARRPLMCRLTLVGWAISAALVGYGAATVWHARQMPASHATHESGPATIARPLVSEETMPSTH